MEVDSTAAAPSRCKRPAAPGSDYADRQAEAKKAKKSEKGGKGGGNGRAMNTAVRLVLSNARDLADMAAAPPLRFEIDSGQPLVAAGEAAGKAYNE
eukprot:4625740-Pyramimonas_sp.AAC.1